MNNTIEEVRTKLHGLITRGVIFKKRQEGAKTVTKISIKAEVRAQSN